MHLIIFLTKEQTEKLMKAFRFMIRIIEMLILAGIINHAIKMWIFWLT